jgi:hypothetical protein
MRKLLLLAVGVAIGYFIGYSDARKHTKHIVERTLDKVGAGTRKSLDNGADRRSEVFDR